MATRLSLRGARLFGKFTPVRPLALSDAPC